jgi:hypothetical protein
VIPVRGKGLSLLHSVQTGSGAHPFSYPRGAWGGGDFSREIKRLGRDPDHSPPSSMEKSFTTVYEVAAIRFQ